MENMVPVLLNERLSRRSLLKNLGAVGMLPMVTGADALASTAMGAQELPARAARPGRESRNDNPALHRIAAGRMVADFDKDLGTIHAITASGDALGTNFLGNQLNTRGVPLGDPHWTGDIVATVWHMNTPEPARPGQTPSAPRRSARWQRETTLDSDDIRKISFDGEHFQVRYEGLSQSEAGIKSFTLAMNHHFAEDRSLLWDIEVTNTTGQLLEIGDSRSRCGPMTITAPSIVARPHRTQRSSEGQLRSRRPFTSRRSLPMLLSPATAPTRSCSGRAATRLSCWCTARRTPRWSASTKSPDPSRATGSEPTCLPSTPGQLASSAIGAGIRPAEAPQPCRLPQDGLPDLQEVVCDRHVQVGGANHRLQRRRDPCGSRKGRMDEGARGNARPDENLQ